MNSIAGWCGAISLGIVAAFRPQVSAAEGFTGVEFNAWETSAQDSYIQTSMTMVGVVLAQLQPDKARCINDWYFADGQSSARNSFIRKTIASYQDYHPSGVILAIVAEECGQSK
ncbi:MAG: hypothetical protein AAGA74_16210 [Pseudomonadota bacterium]